MRIKKKTVETSNEAQRRILEKAAIAVSHRVGGDFTKIDSSERRQLLLRAAPHARQPSMLWTKDRKLTKKFYARQYLEFHGQLECEFPNRASRVLGEVDRELDSANGNDLYFNLRCEESTLFFYIPRRAVSCRNGLMIVRLPTDIYEIQRRAQLRYRPNLDDGFGIESEVFQLWLEDLSILDVSSGGIGMQIRFPDAAAADRFRLDLNTRIHFHLDLGVFSFLTQGEVRYLRRAIDEETGDPVVRIGLRFVGLPQETVEAIQMLVLEKSYARLQAMFID